MEFALGVLHWSPNQFWKATMRELMAANAGHIKINKPAGQAEPMSRDEFEELKAKFG